jgi:hypothetical protein
MPRIATARREDRRRDGWLVPSDEVNSVGETDTEPNVLP